MPLNCRYENEEKGKIIVILTHQRKVNPWNKGYLFSEFLSTLVRYEQTIF
jgi:hypothetical protein